MANTIDLKSEDRSADSILSWLEGRDADLARQAVAARADGRLLDLTAALPEADRIEILTFDDEAGREVVRHTASHAMAQAVQQLHPGTLLAIGPAIEDGFYYDFDTSVTFGPEDLEKIEARMAEIVKAALPIARKEMPRAEAIQFFRERSEKYKVELLEDLPDETVTLYSQGDFVDLCRGPHLPSTGRLKAFKLLNTAGAYWRGDERNPMLQRIYGTAFATQEQLDEHLRLRKEAARRDHRLLGRELDLFSLPEQLGGGLALWHPKGALMRYLIEEFWRKEHLKRGYELVFSPHIARARLWESSGHLSFFREGMYGPMMIEDEEYRIKPMNCPFHVLIYKSQLRSYRELPIRYAELGTVYRYERSGVLHGLLRVRGFTQDDAHIICTPDQIHDEIKGCLDFGLFLMHAFGYEQLEMDLSVRGEADHDKYMGSDDEWEIAERSLMEALESRGLAYKRAPGEAIFYGPKIDIKLKDAMGRLWQGPTIQFDFNLTSRFNMEYVGADGERHTPLMVHRALFGSLDRFFGGYIEHTGGAFPLWLSPVQVRILPIADRHHDYAQQVASQLREAGVRIEVDDRKATTGAKIRDGETQKIPYLLIVGDREQSAGTVAVRARSEGDLGPKPLAEFIAAIREELGPPRS
ncbi:MAG: threonine--tRNA ligase [Armatimonadota bacterium]|nr:MAG: threonine--tRNA ligase [Armatimonadota bacterium]